MHKKFLKHELVIGELKTTKEFAEMCVEHQRRFDMFCEEGNCSSVFSMSSHWKTSFEGWNHAQTKNS